MAEPVTGTRPSWALVAVLAGNMLLDALEVSVVLPALPGIGLPPHQAQWIMSGFALGFAAVLLAGPRVTARWGRRRVYLLALPVFAAASVAGGLTTDFGVLVATRVLKGACAALTAPAGLAVITTVFPDGPRQRRAVSVYALFGAAGFTSGILLSGVLASLDWHWVFLAPAPIALVLLVFAALLIPPDRPGAVMRPFPRALLRNGALLRSAFGAAVLNGTYLSALLLTTFALKPDGMGPMTAALALLPACLPVALASPFARKTVERFGTARLISAGTAFMTAGYGYQLLPSDGSYPMRVLPTLILVGLGFALAFTALNMQAIASVEPADRGWAAPLYQCGVQCGAVLLLSLTTAVPGPWVVVTLAGAAGVAVAAAR
ncbi:Predicted arabinose efflux permease, MFS family [Amycolatopsis xylanica]|uniref:Predicted arabinose efflux permease, MFS family n=1 Tax=Amycolatopsis xylanica TaxID=589385 RepID=A0A1H3RC46_9PSEU|nr:MFS transporter [Amycolatopsis xylanica]SDZ23412.1 Predicted arabinose efflux permease, MFS family [Amycolatopsis xylanica]